VSQIDEGPGPGDVFPGSGSLKLWFLGLFLIEVSVLNTATSGGEMNLRERGQSLNPQVGVVI
jgi:hypothetical protein